MRFGGGWDCTSDMLCHASCSGKSDIHCDRRPSSLLSLGGAAAIILFTATTSLVTTVGAAEVVRVANAQLQLGFDARDGRLRELVDLATGHNHVGTAPDELWRIQFPQTTGPGVLAPTEAKSFRSERLTGHPQALRLTWADFGNPQAPGLRVEITVRLEPHEPVSLWGLRVEGLGPLVPGRIQFPRLPDVAQQANERLAVPVWQGQLATDPRAVLNPPNAKALRREWEYPGRLALQCVALCAEAGPGLYIACNDAQANRKHFAVFGGDTSKLGFEIVHVPEQQGSSEGGFTLPYQVVLGTFKGDWFTAAQRYRAWATNQVWARESRLRKGLVPDWVLNTGMWVWNRGRSTNVLGPAVELQQKLDLPVSVLWHWWHGCSYDTGFPEYLPPREGEKPFQSALAAAHKQDVHALVYMNQRLWGMTTRSWTNEGAERFAVKDASGKIHPEVYNTFTKAPCVSMCMGTEFWRSTYADLAVRAARELGVDGIYMDQACSSLACYDTNHGHPLGGGTYWMQGFRDLSAAIRRRTVSGRRRDIFVVPKFSATSSPSPRVALAGEGCGEAWLPYLDLMLSLEISRERYASPDGWETIPFFNAVYHDCAITFGNYSSLTLPPYDDLWPTEFAPKEPLKLLDRKFSRQFYLEQARAFVWGQQPTVANFLPSHLTQRAEETEFATRLARIRSRATKYLLHGTFLRPPLDAPEALLDISRLSIYAGQQGGLTTFQKRVPLALAGAWRAPDGNVAIALVSISDEPSTLSFSPDAQEYRLPEAGRIYRMDETKRELMGEFSAQDVPVTLDLSPRGACVLEFVPR